MKKRRQIFLVYRFLCFLMAVHVINLSIDTPLKVSFSSRATVPHNDLSINIIDSITELLLETCLGIVDAVPEQDVPNEKSELAEEEEDYSFTQSFVFTPVLPSVHYLAQDSPLFRPLYFPLHVSEIIAPPPKTGRKPAP